MVDGRRVRHIVLLSGGKDSSALAIYLRDKIPDAEYVFCDTGAELPETYEYLERLEAFLGKPIVVLRLKGMTLSTLIERHGGYLPSAHARYCTSELKIRPFEWYVGDDYAYTYIALRADEAGRKGLVPTKRSIVPRYPFVEDGITHDDVMRILDESGLGLPAYYRWRSRSGCYCCFFQQRIEWVGLLENHPELFWRAAGMEKVDEATGKRFTWNSQESLLELARPERIAQIKQHHADVLEAERALVERVGKERLVRRPSCEGTGEDGCVMCHL